MAYRNNPRRRVCLVLDAHALSLTSGQLAKILSRSEEGLHISLRSDTEFWRQVNAARKRLERRVHFSTERIAEIIGLSWTPGDLRSNVRLQWLIPGFTAKTVGLVRTPFRRLSHACNVVRMSGKRWGLKQPDVGQARHGSQRIGGREGPGKGAAGTGHRLWRQESRGDICPAISSQGQGYAVGPNPRSRPGRRSAAGCDD